MTELILVRHGQTTGNVNGQWTGWGETELTELGRSQADATARHLTAKVRDTAALYTSPLSRARQTAEIISRPLRLAPIPLDDLREINFGHLDGIDLERMKTDHPTLYSRWLDKTDSDFAWPGGERRREFFQRVAVACDHILSRHNQGTVLIVSHGGTMRSILRHLLPEQLGEWWSYALDNCGLTRVVVEGKKAHLLTLNDTTHLQEAQ